MIIPFGQPPTKRLSLDTLTLEEAVEYAHPILCEFDGQSTHVIFSRDLGVVHVTRLYNAIGDDNFRTWRLRSKRVLISDVFELLNDSILYGSNDIIKKHLETRVEVNTQREVA